MNGYGRTEEIALGIRGVVSRCGIQHSGCGESALFLFSAGRGSGADELAGAVSGTFVVGDETAFPPGVIDGLARQLIGIGFHQARIDPSPEDAASSANRDQRLAQVARAQIHFYKEMCSASVKRGPPGRWGFLQYDLPAEYAIYLRFLFPAANFLFLRRNPVDSYRSFLAQQATTIQHNETLAASFQNHCSELANGFERWHREVDGLLLDYERLASGGAEEVEAFLGAAISDEMRAMWRSSQRPSEVPSEGVSTVTPSLPGSAAAPEASAAQGGVPVPRGLVQSSPTGDAAQCAVLVPISRYIEPECEESLRALEQLGYVVRRLYGCPAIDAARNILATRALEEGFEETLWVDADVGFDPGVVEQLRDHYLPIVCGICAKKGVREVAAGLLPGTGDITFGEAGGLMEILYAGTGFLHVRRQVYETIRDKLSLPTCNAWSDRRAIPFFMPMIEQWGDQFTYLAEDYGFCRRARQCGFKIYADTSIRLWHIGSYRYGYEDASGEIPRVKTHRYRPPGA